MTDAPDAPPATRTAAQKRRSANIIRLVTGLIGVAVVVSALWPRSYPDVKAGSAASCSTPARQAFSDVWTPDRRAALEPSHRSAAFARAADALDAYRMAWIIAYATACGDGGSARSTAKARCLIGQRDELRHALGAMLQRPPEAFDTVDMSGVLPRIEVCDHALDR